MKRYVCFVRGLPDNAKPIQAQFSSLTAARAWALLQTTGTHVEICEAVLVEVENVPVAKL